MTNNVMRLCEYRFNIYDPTLSTDNINTYKYI